MGQSLTEVKKSCSIPSDGLPLVCGSAWNQDTEEGTDSGCYKWEPDTMGGPGAWSAVGTYGWTDLP